MSIMITGQNELPYFEYSGVSSQNKTVHVLLLPSVSFLGRVALLVDGILWFVNTDIINIWHTITC